MYAQSKRAAARQRRREGIIAAAEKLFFSKGYVRSTMDDISREAQFSKRTVYACFNSKEQIYFEVMIRGYRKMIGMLQDAAGASERTDPVRRLRNLALTFYRFSREYPDYFDAIMSYENGEIDFQKGIPDQSRDACYALGEKALGMLTSVLEAGQKSGVFRPKPDSAKAALALWSCFVGVVQATKIKSRYLAHYHRTSADELIDCAVLLLIRSLTNDCGGQTA